MGKENMRIICPDCGNSLDINEHLNHQLRADMERERERIESRIRHEIQGEHDKKLESLKKRLFESEEQLNKKGLAEMQSELEMKRLQQEIEENEKRIEMEREDAALEARQAALSEYDKIAEERAERKNADLQMRNNELSDKLRQQEELFREQLRKAEQRSIQAQGEGGEIFIRDALKASAPEDEILDIPTGKKGADILQIVRFGSGIKAGTIVWEGKRAKSWQKKWISKVKEDTVESNGHISVIVSDVLPSGTNRMRMIEDNVWVCTYVEIQSLSIALRMGLIRAEMTVKSQESKGTKMELLYDYMSSQEFSNAMRLIDDSIVTEIEIIEKERRSSERHWSARKKAVEARLRGFSDFFGTVKSIATELPMVEELEMSDERGLPPPKGASEEE